MYCRICGTEENVSYYPAKRQSLCRYCSKDTPAKVGREAFDKAMKWDADAVEGIKREFYEDYLASTNTLKDYLVAISTPSTF